MPDSIGTANARPVAHDSLAIEAERRWHEFFEASPDTVALVDPAGRIVHLNAAVDAMFGYRPEQLLGRPVEILMPERFRARHAEHHLGYYAAPRARRMGNGLQMVGLRQDGTEFPIDIALSPLHLGETLFVAAAIRDMSQYQELQAQLRQRSLDLEEADRRKDQFLAVLAHELRNPLAALSQACELLRQPGADGRSEWIAGVMERQTGHMLTLVEDLLDVARIRRGTVILRRQPTDLVGVAARAVEISRPLVEGRRHTLEVIVPAHTVQVDADGLRLVQVVTNLLTNAARYTPEGGWIRLTLAEEAGSAVLTVADNGIGISPDMLTRIFELFVQADPSGKDPSAGLGIGLALVRPLVELHGGTVTADSDGIGRGSEFVVRIPLLA